jgi:6-phospho-beta-glucosidase
MIDDLIDTKLSQFFEKEPFYRDLEKHIRETRTIPNEYLYYYLNSQKVMQNQKDSKATRAEVIGQLDDELYRNLLEKGDDPIEVFNRYMDARNSSYMTMESGAERSQPRFDLFHQERANGYDAIALNVLSSLLNPGNQSLILNIKNDGFDPDLQDDDVIEVSTIAKNGWFVPIGESTSIARGNRELLLQMKQYERNVITAIQRGGEEAAIYALASHPFFNADAERVYTCFKQAQITLEEA